MAVVGAFGVLAGSASALVGPPPTLVNPSFESGNTTGWNLFVPPGGATTIVAAHTSDLGHSYTAVSGSKFARVKTNGPGSYATVSQTFAAAAGDTLSGCAFFDAQDYFPFDDNASVKVFQGSSELDTLWSEGVNHLGNYGDGPWVQWSYTFPANGTYTIQARIANALDSVLDSYLGFDVGPGTCAGGYSGGDHFPPVLHLPNDITTPATSPAGATVSYVVTATDNLDPNPTVSCSPPSGSVFPIGTTTVTCTATDATNHTSTGSFAVTVEQPADSTPPVVTVPADMTQEATSAGGANVDYAASAEDDVDGALTPVCAPASGSLFALGGTTVTCTATDAAGNSASASFTVTVQDTTAPAVTCVNGPNPAGKNEPNGNAGFRTITATDAVGVVTLQIVDSASSFVSSNLSSGWNLKLTRSPGNASEKGMAGVVSRHISTTGAPKLRAVDAAGNVTQVDC